MTNEDIQALIEGIINVGVHESYNECGGDYIFSCPFCPASSEKHQHTEYLKHELDCLYILAKKLKDETT